MAEMGESSEMGNGLYTDEQVEILEQVYHENQKPSQSKRLEMINKYPCLSNLESKEIQSWFQNHRLHEMQKKKDMESMALKDKLTATQQLLLTENARLNQELLQLENESEDIQLLMTNASSSTTDQHAESAHNPHSLEAADNPTRSFLLAEESHTNFMTVSKRSTIGWLPTPRMKALHFIVQLVEEKSGKLTPLRNKETLLLSFSQLSTGRLSGSNRNHQSLMYYDAAESLNMAMNSIKKLVTISSFTAALSFPGTILCVQVSLLLKKMDNYNFEIATDGEINVAQSVEEAKNLVAHHSWKRYMKSLPNYLRSFNPNQDPIDCRALRKCDKQDMVIAKSTKNLEDNLDVQFIMTPGKPGSIEASMLADWIYKSFGSNKGGIFLKSNGQSQQSVWKWLWYIKFQGYAVLLAGICKSGAI